MGGVYTVSLQHPASPAGLPRGVLRPQTQHLRQTPLHLTDINVFVKNVRRRLMWARGVIISSTERMDEIDLLTVVDRSALVFYYCFPPETDTNITHFKSFSGKKNVLSSKMWKEEHVVGVGGGGGKNE